METSHARFIGKIQAVFPFTLDLWVGSLEELVGPVCKLLGTESSHFSWWGMEILLGKEKKKDL